MKFKVTAIAVDITQTPFGFSKPRDEIIDTEQNVLFTACTSIQDVEVAYEGFWNYLGGPDVVSKPSQKIKVLAVSPLEHRQPESDMHTYSFRAECLDDVKNFQRVCAIAGIAATFRVEPGVFQMPEPPSGPEVQMETDVPLEQLRVVMRQVVDGHVMLQTLRACPLSENSLERDYDLH